MTRFAATLILCLFAATWATAQQSDTPVITVRLRSEQESYSIRGEIRLELQRENAGGEGLAVTRELGWGAGRTNIRVFDAGGKEVVTDFLFDEVPPPPQPCDFVVLDKGDFIGTRLHEPLTHFVSKPGRYEFVVEYTSYLSAELCAKGIAVAKPAVLVARERHHDVKSHNRCRNRMRMAGLSNGSDSPVIDRRNHFASA